MHRMIWPAATLILAIMSFAAGRMTLSFRTMPEIVATLPSDESQFSRELDDRVRERFPIGSSEDKLIGYLDSANFIPDWRRRDDDNASLFIWNGLLCNQIVRVAWRADAAGILTKVSGSYQSHCL